jgi:hypothetical protein
MVSAGNELVAALSGAADAPELLIAARNVGIDAAIIAVAAAGWNIDRTNTNIVARGPRPPPVAAATAAPCLDAISDLEVRLRLTDPAAKRGEASIVEKQIRVGVLQSEARQNLVVIVGTDAVIENLLLSAIVSRSAFASANLLLVPVAFELGDAQSDALKAVATAKGFAKPSKSKGSSVTFVAPPSDQTAWSSALSAEVAIARAEGARSTPPFDPVDKGILLVVGPQQQVLQRRLGRPPQWSTFIEEVSAAELMPNREPSAVSGSGATPTPTD